jgi:uncharacterized membrane protein
MAVAITLLALNLSLRGPGHGSFLGQLSYLWPGFASYAVSFATIGIIWVNHHELFRNLATIDRTLLFLNVLMLFWIVLIPFATATVAMYMAAGSTDSRMAAALYVGVFEGMSLSFLAVFLWAARHALFKGPVSPRFASVRFGAGSIGYLVAALAAFVAAPLALTTSALIAAYYVFEQTPVDHVRAPRI